MTEEQEQARSHRVMAPALLPETVPLVYQVEDCRERIAALERELKFERRSAAGARVPAGTKEAQMTETARIREIARAVERIRPILAFRPPGMQGAILATLQAMWLAGHHAEDEATTRTLRKDLLELHCIAVLQLVEIDTKILDTPPDERRR